MRLEQTREAYHQKESVFFQHWLDSSTRLPKLMMMKVTKQKVSVIELYCSFFKTSTKLRRRVVLFELYLRSKVRENYTKCTVPIYFHL